MSDTPVVPGAPNLGEFIEMQTNPDLSIKGVLLLNGDDLPPDRTIGRMVRTKITTPGEYIETEWYSRRLVVVDTSRPDLVPNALTDAEHKEKLHSTLADASYDVWINLLKGGSDGELGEIIRTKLVEPEQCYDSEQGESVPGYHDPLDDDNARPGEQRAFVVVNGS